MNIVHIYPNAKRFHGAVKILFLFCTKLEEIGHNNTILCGSINRHVPDWFSGKIVSLFKNPLANKEHVGFKKILFVLFQNIIPFLLPFKLKKMQPDVIVFHSEPSLFAVITARILQIKSKYIYYCYQAPEEFYNYSKETKAIKKELRELKTIRDKKWFNDISVDIKETKYAEYNVDCQINLGIEKFKNLVDNGDLIIIGAMYDFHNMYGFNKGGLYITNVNGETDAEKVKKMGILEELSDEVREIRIKRLG